MYAKLNLTLAVGERQGEFHPIDSVATSVDICDVVEVLPRVDREVTVRGVVGVAQENNVAHKAACAFVEAFSTKGVDVSIQKGIPFGAGMGGSSADASAVIFCMCKLFGVDLDSQNVSAICQAVGSDVTYMLRGGLGRLRGKGDAVEFFTLKRPLYFALTTFEEQMSSREVYQAFDRISTQWNPSANDELLVKLEEGMNRQALKYFCNDLQPAAVSISDYAAQYLAFAKSNKLNAVMTGSGSAYYVAYARSDDAQRAVDLLNAHGFSTVLCKTVSSGIVI